jgi:hypothetical protein
MGFSAEARDMSRTPAVSCSGCGFSWNSAAMAEGLRVLGSCPRCGGSLQFREHAPEPARSRRPEPAPALAPHLVLGIPRR